MPRVQNVLLFLIVWTVLTILAVGWGTTFDWPDYFHVSYGFPLVWGIHTLSTIAGPADIWKVDPQSLIVDLVFWLGVMLATVAIMLCILYRRNSRKT